MKKKPAAGFTLIELMIVVAIIGILASLAIPNFLKFQARARQSEAKANLKGIYTATQSYFVEYGTYICGTCGFAPQPRNRYTYNFDGTATFVTDTNTNVAACNTGVATAAQSQTAFKSTAAGQIDSDATCDCWSITNTNVLNNDVNDVDT